MQNTPQDNQLFSSDQHRRLIESAGKLDGMQDWNKWRDDNPDVEILLAEAPLQGVRLSGANLQGAGLVGADLQGATLFGANLQDADLREAELRGAKLWYADIRGTIFRSVIVDGETVIHTAKVDRRTDFSGVGLAGARVKRGLRQVLEYNIRRIGWRQWCKEHPLTAMLARAFWGVSDYGFSTRRILCSIGLVSALFAVIYTINPGFLHLDSSAGELRGFTHALYFSVVTTTTLGFGDIRAHPDSGAGQWTLMVHVLLGYVLLGALIARLAVLFSADGPALGFYVGWDRPELDLSPEDRWYARIGKRCGFLRQLAAWKKQRIRQRIVDDSQMFARWLSGRLMRTWEEFVERVGPEWD